MKIIIPKKDPIGWRAQANPDYATIYRHLPSYVHSILEHTGLKPKRVTLWDENGYSSYIFVLHEKNRKLALKVSPKNDLISEIYFYDKLRELKIPVPKVLRSDTTKKVIPYMFHVTEWIDGELAERLSGEALYAVARRVGRVLAKVHTVRVGGFGALQSNGQWSYGSSRTLLQKGFFFDSVRPNSVRGIFGDKVFVLIKNLLRDRRLRIKQPSLIHGDVGADQFLVEKRHKTWRLRAILDPGHQIGGDPMFDLAYSMISWNKKRFPDGVYDGYVSVHPLSKAEMCRYGLLRFICQVWAASFLYQRRSGSAKDLAEDALALIPPGGL